MSQKSLTVVIPVYDEEQALSRNFEIILQHLDGIGEVKVDVLLVDDGSSDKTVEIAAGLCRRHDHVKLISLTRNFGKESAIHAGLDHAKGDAVLVMDSDLQHPPQLIPRMVSIWLNGTSIVEAYKSTRGKESIFSNLLAGGFYRIFSTLSGMDLCNQSDFKLLDRKVVEAYKGLPECSRFFRGMVRWLGFPAVQIPFDVPQRRNGSSSWSRLSLARFSIAAITSYSAAPLQFVTLLGILTFLISSIFGSIALYDKLTGTAVSGFTTVILLILIIGSILMMSLGLLGIYIAKIYDETKARPSYVIDYRSSK